MSKADSRTLLADYVEHGSETAFRELVSRYSELVYGAAFRQVNGDEQLAKDISQNVFIDLARLARGLKQDVLLGGWLHRRVCHVAATVLRGDRRRQAREKEALMRSITDAPEVSLVHVRLCLDEAINHLGADDRAAILLRYFDGMDLRAVGEQLGINEDCAQKRVSRALDKLHLILRRQDVVLPVGALAAVLASEAACAAPAMWAGSVAGAALAGAAAQSGTWLTFIQLLIMTKINVALTAAVAAALVAVPWWIQHDSSRRLRVENQELRKQITRLEQSANPASDLAFAGFGTPEAAAQSLLLAMVHGDLEKLRECMTPEAWEQMRPEFEGKSAAELSAMLKAQGRNAKIPSTREKVYPDGRVVVAITAVDSVNGQLRGHDESMATFKQVGQAWKLVPEP
jgi:RNA polymerase sigma factor (sigma-70 family)